MLNNMHKEEPGPQTLVNIVQEAPQSLKKKTNVFLIDPRNTTVTPESQTLGTSLSRCELVSEIEDEYLFLKAEPTTINNRGFCIVLGNVKVCHQGLAIYQGPASREAMFNRVTWF